MKPSLGLSPGILEICSSLEMLTPTPIQKQAIPKVLEGEDVVVMSPTGTGKTATFILPIIHKLADDPYGVFAMVVSPSRELAVQTLSYFNLFAGAFGLRGSLLVGGVDQLFQSGVIQSSPHLVCGTPGRIRLFLHSDGQRFRYLKFLVFDEAHDCLLDKNKKEDIVDILKMLPSKENGRQTICVSATIPANFETQIADIPNMPTKFLRADTNSLPEVSTSITHTKLICPSLYKIVFLRNLLAGHFEDSRGFCFVNTCMQASIVSEVLKKSGVAAEVLHGLHNMKQRLKAINMFRSGQLQVLVATDVLSCGIDVPNADFVIHFHMPRDVVTYIHRSGRASRQIGMKGQSFMLIGETDFKRLKQIEKHCHFKAEKMFYEDSVMLKGIKKLVTLEKLAEIKLLDSGFEEKRKKIRQKGN